MKEKGYTLAEMLVLAAVLAWLAVIVGVVWTAVHFIAKFW